MSDITVLKELTPIARKEHRCMFCGTKINIGEKYERKTCVFDGDLYDWIAHLECEYAAVLLDMYSKCIGDGLSEDDFHECIHQYINEKYCDYELDDIAKYWQLPIHECVKKIVEEIKNKINGKNT